MADDVGDIKSFAQLINPALDSSRASFAATVPPSFLSFDGSLNQPFDFANVSEMDGLISRMSRFTFAGKAHRKLSYAPAVANTKGLVERLEASMAMGAGEDVAYSFEHVVKAEAVILRPDSYICFPAGAYLTWRRDNDVLLVAEKRTALPNVRARKSNVAKQIEHKGTTFHLIDGRHARTSVISAAATLPELDDLPGAEWQMVKSHHTLPLSEQSSRLQVSAFLGFAMTNALQLRLGDLSDPETALSNLAEVVQRL